MKHLFALLMTGVLFFGGLFAYTPSQQDYDLINSFEPMIYEMTDSQLVTLIDKLDYFINKFQHHERVVFVLEHISASAQYVLNNGYNSAIDPFDDTIYSVVGDIDLSLTEPFLFYDSVTNSIVTSVCIAGHDTPVRVTLLFTIAGKDYNKSIILPHDGSETECENYSFSLTEFALKAGPSYHVELVVDPYNYLQEYDEENNYIATIMQLPNYIDNYPHADLAVEYVGYSQGVAQVIVSQEQLHTNQEVDLYLYTRNHSYKKTINFGDEKSQVVYFDDVEFENMYYDSTLTAVIDPFDAVYESDETNNKMAKEVSVESQFDFYIKQSSYAALTDTINLTVCNAYDFHNSDDQYVVDVRIGAANKAVTRSVVLPQHDYLGLHNCASIQVSLGAFAIVTPKFSYEIVVDPNNYYQESDETNNIVESTAKVY